MSANTEISEDLKDLALSLGYAWPDDQPGRWRVLKLMAERASYWRAETEKYRDETQREVERHNLYTHLRNRLAAQTKRVRNLRRALRNYMASQAAFVREAKAEIVAAQKK